MDRQITYLFVYFFTHLSLFFSSLSSSIEDVRILFRLNCRNCNVRHYFCNYVNIITYKQPRHVVGALARYLFERLSFFASYYCTSYSRVYRFFARSFSFCLCSCVYSFHVFPPSSYCLFCFILFFFYLSNTDYPEEDENQSDKTINRREGKERMRRGRESMRREKA